MHIKIYPRPGEKKLPCQLRVTKLFRLIFSAWACNRNYFFPYSIEIFFDKMGLIMWFTFWLIIPGHQVHAFMDRVFFGKSYWKLHDLIDMYYLVYRCWHRRFFHDGPSTILIAKNEYPYDPIAVEAACLHVLLDEMCSQNPELKKWLKKTAKDYYKKMKHSIFL